jgi:dTDP-4-dehydrorhamnose 3,5-epimerase
VQVRPTRIADVVVVEPDVHRDPRGYFLETYQAARYREGGIADAFVQDNESRSVRGVLRGLHAQRRYPQGKLVRVLAGAIYDVAVDVRPGSPTYGQWVAVTLTAESFEQLYVPPGFVHGFCVTSETATIAYKCTTPYAADDEVGVCWNDPDLDIPWPIANPIVSAKDAALPRLSAAGPLVAPRS